jgi:hypothetical protein
MPCHVRRGMSYFAKQTTDLGGYVGAPIMYLVVWVYFGTNTAFAPLVALLLYELHFVKRCYEVCYVHGRKRAPVGITDAIIEWCYYIGFAAVLSTPRMYATKVALTIVWHCVLCSGRAGPSTPRKSPLRWG